jgi:hypothetical protein
LHYSKKSIEQRRAKEWIVDEVVSDAVDVRIDHERINETEDQHHPERDARIKEEEREKVCEMQETREGGYCVQTCVRKKS